jgi:hypothetical protein
MAVETGIDGCPPPLEMREEIGLLFSKPTH